VTFSLLAGLAVLAYAAGYTGMCAVFPYGHCRRCKGTGKHYSPFSHKVFRDCPRCTGSGKRTRLGRRIYQHLRNKRQ
jgi:hypothetical protein